MKLDETTLIEVQDYINELSKLIKNAQENIEYGIPCEIDKLIP